MTGLILLVALAIFWGGVVLAILSGVGVISAPIWAILLVCGILLVICIIALHFASIDEYGTDYEPSPAEKAELELRRKFIHGDQEIFDMIDEMEENDT